MLYSVVILSFNSERTLDKCLSVLTNTLSKSQLLGPSEIFVVENGSLDKSPQILQKHVELFPEMVKPIVFAENTGTTVSRNAALKKCSGEYVLVLDSDAYIDETALRVLREKLDDEPGVGMAVPKLFYGDGRFQLSTDVFPTLAHKIKRFLSLDGMQEEIDHTSLVETDVDYAISACWLLRKDAVDNVAGFDENIFYSPEDVEYCMQVWSKGYRIRYVPGAEVVHDAQELSRGFKLSFFHFSHLSGLLYLFKKYRYFFGLSGLYARLGRNK